MEIVPYSVHQDVATIVKHYKLKILNMDRYVFDDIHENQEYLNSLDTKEWKQQDHYSVLRLKKVRFNASQELIKKAYRKQLLDHHPDKGRKRLKKCEDENSDYFVCITQAYDFLRNPVSRRSYDSVDPQFDDHIPTLREAKADFFSTFSVVFDVNSRWSKLQPVPSLGDDNTPYEQVLTFYQFWDNFSSWREFSYLDEEGKGEAENREERRYYDKLNKSERKKKSVEETKRIHSLISLAQSNDPRLKRYNDQRKAEKEAEKRAKEERKMQLRMDSERVLRDEKEQAEREAAEKSLQIKEETANLKKQREVQKTRIKTEKRRLRKIAETEVDFVSSFVNGEPHTKSIEMRKAEMMNVIEILCHKLSLEELISLNDALEVCASGDRVALIKGREQELRTKNGVNGVTNDSDTFSGITNDSVDGQHLCGDRAWDFDLTQLLIKAINHYVTGTKNRWMCVADYMNNHVAGLTVNEKQIIHKAKSLKKDDTQQKKEAAVHNFTSKSDQGITESLKKVHITDRSDVRDTTKAWTPDEQKQLESALKTVPASDPARWDKISQMVSTRSKKECILRFKDLAEKLKAKKAAQ